MTSATLPIVHNPVVNDLAAGHSDACQNPFCKSVIEPLPYAEPCADTVLTRASWTAMRYAT